MKKISLFFLTLLLTISMAGTAYGADYGYKYPDYVPVSGGAFVEVESSLGTVALVFPNNYKNGYFGFVDRGSASIGNISNNTISGYLYTGSGQSYSVRASYGELIEYNTNSGYPYNQWVDLRITKILNTNINFIDLTDEGRQTDFQKYDFSVDLIFLYSLIVVCTFFVILTIWLRCRNGNH